MPRAVNVTTVHRTTDINPFNTTLDVASAAAAADGRNMCTRTRLQMPP
jgi:hypothetical protein